MYCPKCAAQNADDAKFCRSCGADISLVPQAVTGQLAERLAEEGEGSREHRRRRRRGSKITIERAVKSVFMGIAWVFVAFAAKSWAPAGNIWWFWLFIPAAGYLADGISTWLRLQEEKKNLEPPYDSKSATLASPRRASALPPSRHTGEIYEAPPSVTEATTRHLGIPVERKPDDA